MSDSTATGAPPAGTGEQEDQQRIGQEYQRDYADAADDVADVADEGWGW